MAESLKSYLSTILSGFTPHIGAGDLGVGVFNTLQFSEYSPIETELAERDVRLGGDIGSPCPLCNDRVIYYWSGLHCRNSTPSVPRNDRCGFIITFDRYFTTVDGKPKQSRIPKSA